MFKFETKCIKVVICDQMVAEWSVIQTFVNMTDWKSTIWTIYTIRSGPKNELKIYNSVAFHHFNFRLLIVVHNLNGFNDQICYGNLI